MRTATLSRTGGESLIRMVCSLRHCRHPCVHPMHNTYMVQWPQCVQYLAQSNAVPHVLITCLGAVPPSLGEKMPSCLVLCGSVDQDAVV